MKALRWSVLLILLLLLPAAVVYFNDSNEKSWYWTSVLDRPELLLLLKTTPALTAMTIPEGHERALSLNGQTIPFTSIGTLGAYTKAEMEAIVLHAKDACRREKVSLEVFANIAILLQRMGLSSVRHVYGHTGEGRHIFSPPSPEAEAVGIAFTPVKSLTRHWYYALDEKAPPPGKQQGAAPGMVQGAAYGVTHMGDGWYFLSP